MRKKIVAGNWKMNTVVPQGETLAKEIVELSEETPSDVTLIVAPPFTHLSKVAEALKGSKVAPVEYVILGHSERREYYGETNAKLVEKIRLALAENLSVIYCVGEKLEEREKGEHFNVIASQIREVLFNLTAEQFSKVVIAYEPVWAIGTGKTATSAQAQEVHEFIRKTVAEKFGQDAADQTSILYGGSCKPGNARELFACKDIDGGLIGGASLVAGDFIAIAKSF